MKKEKDKPIGFNFYTRLITIVLGCMAVVYAFWMIVQAGISIGNIIDVSKNYNSNKEFVDTIVERNVDEDKTYDNFFPEGELDDETIVEIQTGEIEDIEVVTEFYISNIVEIVHSVFAFIILILFFRILNKDKDLINMPFTNKTLNKLGKCFSLIIIEKITIGILSCIGMEYFTFEFSVFESYEILETIILLAFVLLFYAKKLKTEKAFED